MTTARQTFIFQTALRLVAQAGMPVPLNTLLTSFSCSLAAFAAGCATTESIPTYPATQPSTIVETIHARSTSLRSATGKGAVTLNSPQRGSIRLEAAFVLQPPDHARVRAWKFNQAVFDLTVKPEGAWLYSPRDPSAAASTSTGNVGGGIRDWLTYLGSGVPAGSVVTHASDTTVTLQSPDTRSGGTLTTTIDRPTRTVRQYRLVDAAGVERFTLSLGRYRELSGTLWPTRIEAKAATGSMVVETDALEPDAASPAAFTPPARAARLP